MGTCNSADHDLSHSIINIVANNPELWIVNGQEVPKNGMVRARNDGHLYVRYRNDLEYCLNPNVPIKCCMEVALGYYYLGYIKNGNQIKLFVTFRDTNISIMNESKYDFKIEYHERHLGSCETRAQYLYHTKETYLLKQTFGKYRGRGLRLYTLKGTEIRFMERRNEGYFPILDDRIIDGLKISFDKTTEKFTITDQ
jgi:hypothetical protein